ncbi:DUF6894 family protein [Bosea sp. TAF32]|uniref:DUF6894 family protein n=1 Tax=Bosea sp. TAF32 TaxID=3237482 RepID=UPI003F8E31E9
MPKYRFTTEEGNRVDRDEKPLDFPNEKAAKEDAQRALADSQGQVAGWQSL